jgi:hypothetical protein
VFEALTGIGLSASAGLNAYIPLLVVGVLGRYTGLIVLPAGWSWLENGWVIGILAVLLAIEVVADKVPAVDSVNDVLQTVVRPASGGLVFGAASASQTATVSDPGDFFTSNQWVPVVAGVIISLVVHGAKATARPVLNVTTGGVAAPVVSTAEDATSAVMSVVAIVLPILVLVFLFALFGGFVWLRERRRQAATRR